MGHKTNEEESQHNTIQKFTLMYNKEKYIIKKFIKF